MGSNREVIEESPEVDSASDIDVAVDDQVNDTDTDDTEVEDIATDDEAQLEVEKVKAKGRLE
jgi:hypothetical protein